MSNIPAHSSFLTPPPEIHDFLGRYKSFALIGHTEPDGDCLGSQIAMAMFLRSRGAEVNLYSDGPFNRPEVQNLSPMFSASWKETDHSHETAIIIVDCSTPDRIGSFRQHLENHAVCVIDHHASGDHFGDCRWIEPSAPSVTVMALALIESFGSSPDRNSAEELFFGLATDTGFFRHLDESGTGALEAAARLVQAGASPKAAFARMYGNRPFSSRILLGRLLSRSRQLAGGRLIYTWETLADVDELGPDARDSDALYQLLLGTRNCEAAAVIREEPGGTLSAGLRALFKLNVGAIAKEFGGGGHAKAAGFSYTGSREELEDKLLPMLQAGLT